MVLAAPGITPYRTPRPAATATTATANVTSAHARCEQRHPHGFCAAPPLAPKLWYPPSPLLAPPAPFPAPFPAPSVPPPHAPPHHPPPDAAPSYWTCAGLGESS